MLFPKYRARRILRQAWASRPNDYDTKVLFAEALTSAFTKGKAQLQAEDDYEFAKLYRELGALTEVRPVRRSDGQLIYHRNELN